MNTQTPIAPFDTVSALYAAAKSAAEAVNHASDVEVHAAVRIDAGKSATMRYTVIGFSATMYGGFECCTADTIAEAVAGFVAKVPNTEDRRQNRLAELRVAAAQLGAEVITK